MTRSTAVVEDTVCAPSSSRTLVDVEYEEPHAGADHRPADPFAAIVRALTLEDPRFVRRVTSPAPGGPRAGELMIVVGLLATVLLGVLPLALGLAGGPGVLVVVGAAGCVLLPLGAPLAVRAVLRRLRPLTS